MQKPIRHKANNWVDGMKLSSAHFVATDQYIADISRDTASLGMHDFNYGLLPPFSGHETSYDISIVKKSTNYLEVQVRHLNAITADGARIDILGHQPGDKVYLNTYLDTQQAAAGMHYIALFVNPFKRVPTGEPNPEESPLRYPEVVKEYSIGLVSEQDLEKRVEVDLFLPIGQILHEGGQTEVNQGYIIPSVMLKSNAALVRKHNSWYNGLVQLQDAAIKIMEKTSAKDKITNLGINIRGISEKMLHHFATSLFSYRNLLPVQSPIFTVQYFSDLAHAFFTCIKVLPGQDREEMLKYFYEWRDVTPSNFEEKISETIELHYEHRQIHLSMQAIDEFVELMVALWEKLSSLEYIGQRRENIVVAEQKVVQEVQNKRTWSLLD